MSPLAVTSFHGLTASELVATKRDLAVLRQAAQHFAAVVFRINRKPSSPES